MALRSSTAPEHARLEESLELLSPALTLARYREILEKFYGIYATLEEALQPMLRGFMDEAELAERKKLSRLEADLRHLGLTPAQLQQLARLPEADVPPLRSAAAALGVAYVLEGATLGGQVLSRHFGQHLNLQPDSGAGFFNGYGTQTGAKWKAFQEILVAQGQSAAARAEMIQAARLTFVRFAAWTVRAPVGAGSASEC